MKERKHRSKNNEQSNHIKMCLMVSIHIFSPSVLCVSVCSLCAHFTPFTCTCNQIKHAALSVRRITYTHTHTIQSNGKLQAATMRTTTKTRRTKNVNWNDVKKKNKIRSELCNITMELIAHTHNNVRFGCSLSSRLCKVVRYLRWSICLSGWYRFWAPTTNNNQKIGMETKNIGCICIDRLLLRIEEAGEVNSLNATTKTI